MVKIKALKRFEFENKIIREGTVGTVALELINKNTNEDIFLLDFNNVIVPAKVLDFELVD